MDGRRRPRSSASNAETHGVHLAGASGNDIAPSSPSLGTYNSKETQNAQRDAEGRRNCKRPFEDGLANSRFVSIPSKGRQRRRVHREFVITAKTLLLFSASFCVFCAFCVSLLPSRVPAGGPE